MSTMFKNGLTGLMAISSLTAILPEQCTGVSQRTYQETPGGQLSDYELDTNMEHVYWLALLWVDQPERITLDTERDKTGQLTRWRMHVDTGGQGYRSGTEFIWSVSQAI